MMLLWMCLVLCISMGAGAVSKSNITLYYYNQSSISTHIYKFTLADGIGTNYYNCSKPIVIWIHGWEDVTNVDTYHPAFRTNILNANDVNFFAMDYPYNTLYTDSVADQPTLGLYIGQFVNNLTTSCNISLDKVAYIGHSLGCHISGAAGRENGNKTGNLIALDPAGPSFYNNSNSMTSTDSKNVHVIHTNAGGLGSTNSLGDSDFWIDGGSAQPGCFDIYCDHLKSIDYYATSVANPQTFPAYSCTGQSCCQTKTCSASSSSSYAGGYLPSNTASGNYYVIV